MAKVLVTEQSLIDIANAIRAKNGSNNEYTPAQMAAAIQAISTGNSALWTINITQSAHQTISVATSINKSGNSSYTIGPNDTPNVIATVIPDEGYTAGTASVQQSGTTFNVSAATATAATYTVTIAQSANQTITVTCNGTSYTSSFTAPYGASWTASIAADNGYTAGTLSASSGTITGHVTISATSATSSGSSGGDSSSFTKTYNNVTATISNNGTSFSMPSLGSYSDEWWIPTTTEITQHYNHAAVSKGSNSSSGAVYTFTGTLTLDGHELNFSATNNTSSGSISFTDNSNLSAFKTYYQSLGDGTHTFTVVVLTLTNISVKYRVHYGFSSNMDSSAMPNTIYYSQVVNDASSQLINTVPSDEYLSNGATTTVWTPALPSSTVLTDSSNNCTWTFSGYSPASVGGATINGQGIDHYISYSWVASPMVTDTSVSTYEMVIGAVESAWFSSYGYVTGRNTAGSFQCTAGYDDLSYGGFEETIFDTGSGYTGGIGFCDSQGTFIILQNQPTYKIFCNNQLIYDSSQSDGSINVSSLSETILASRIGQTVTIKVY